MWSERANSRAALLLVVSSFKISLQSIKIESLKQLFRYFHFVNLPTEFRLVYVFIPMLLFDLVLYIQRNAKQKNAYFWLGFKLIATIFL